jgi:hypothetical protein
MAEGVHGHAYSPENRRAAFAFIDRAFGRPARDALDTVKVLDPPALRCTTSGQVRVDLPGRSLFEIIRDDFRAARPQGDPARGAASIAERYHGDGYPGIRDWPLVAKGTGPATGVIAWDAPGGATAGGVRIDRYRLYHGGSLVIPLLHVHREGAPRDRAVIDLRLTGKPGAEDWASVTRHLGAADVIAFDLRGTGETRMRYRAASGDDPTLAEADEAQAYYNPLSGVLANHVYNALLVGRPYFLEMIEDVEIVTRFARERLGLTRLEVAPSGDAGLLAEAAAQALPGLEVLPSADAAVFRWSRAVEQMREVWPIQYLLPGGAALDARER